MKYRRRRNILRLLARGGAVTKVGDKYSLHDPTGAKPLKKDEALELLNEGYLVPISCGQHGGFTWALRTDFISIYLK